MVMSRDDAAAALARAVQDHAEAFERVPIADSMLSTFAVVAHWVPVEENGREGYSMHYPTDSLPQHVVIGLLTVASDLIAREADDE